MTKDYQYELTVKEIAGREIVFEKGLGQANFSDPDQTRDFDQIRDQLFPALRESGEMNYGEGSKWDDRKYRFNGVLYHPTRTDTPIFVKVGLTHFEAHAEDVGRGDIANKAIQEIGREKHNDKWAYFARVLGVAVIPITKQGSVFIGQRTLKAYNGWLNAAAGLVDYKGDPTLEIFEKQAVMELREEYGKRLELVDEPRVVGISTHPIKGDADMVSVVRIDVDDDYFISGKWLEEREDAEHAPNLIQIASVAQRDELLDESIFRGGKVPGIIYSTRQGLESLTERNFRNL